MADFNLLQDLLVILVTAFVFGYLAGRLKQPPIVGYVIGGALVALVGGKLTTHSTNTLVDIGVILLMFTLGIEFSFRRLIRVKEIVLYGAALQVGLFTCIFTALLVILWNLSFFQALFLALCFSLSSTAIVVKILLDKGETDTLYGEILLGWLLIQDLLVIPMWVTLPAIWQNINQNKISLFYILFSVIISLIKAGTILYLVYWLGKRLVPAYLTKISKTNSRELFLIAIFLLISFLAILVSAVGISPSLGAFLAGLLVAESTQNHAIFAEVRPLRDILSIIFFVSLGLLFNSGFLIANFSSITLLTLAVITIKILLVTIIMAKFGYHSKTIFFTSAGLVSIGEFAFILGRFGLGQKYINVGIYNYLISVTVLSLILGPLIMSFSHRSYYGLKNLIKKFLPFLYEILFFSRDQNKKFDEELPLNQHVVICGYGRVGRHIGKMLEFIKIPYIVIDFNQKVINELKKHAVNVIYGDPSDIDVLDFAQVDKAKVVVVAVPDRHSQEMIMQNSLSLNKNIIIICRSHFDEDKTKLYSMGAHAIVQPEFEAALRMSGLLLNLYRTPKEEIQYYLTKMRKEE